MRFFPRGLSIDDRIKGNSGGPDAKGCIPWLGWKHKGYAALTVDHERLLVFHHLMPDVPEGFVRDHKCRNKACVNPEHLRLIPDAGNAQNRGARKGSMSGVRGVTRTHNGRWQARYMVDGKSYHVGVFDTVGEAEAAMIAARRQAMPYSVDAE